MEGLLVDIMTEFYLSFFRSQFVVA